MQKSPATNITTLDVEVTCADAVKLSATLFQPKQRAKAAVMIAPATGITQNFYINFATWLATQGYAVVTFDNRGIGKSLRCHVKNSDASLQYWGELDTPAILEFLKDRFPGLSYHLIGHSAGGQLVGLMHNAMELKSILNFACSSGNLSKMSYPFKISAHFFMNVFIPLSNLIFGYTKSQWLGMGEPLPRMAAQQWRRWCNGEGYVKTDFGKGINKHCYDDLETDIQWLYASDDSIANENTVKEMATVYSQSRAEIIRLDPNEYGFKAIGHMGFFRRSNKVLWKLASDRIEKNI